MGIRRIGKNWRKNRTFYIAAVVMALIVGTITAYLSLGVNALRSSVSLTEKAMSTPELLTEQEKTELQKLTNSLSPAEKEMARKRLGR